MGVVYLPMLVYIKLEIEFYLILWLIRNFVAEITIYHWLEICEKDDNKWHIRNIKIKYNIIIKVQIKIRNVTFVVQYHEYDNKINIYYSSSHFDCIITNNPQCIIWLNSIRLITTGSFSKWCLLALNKVNNNRALFEVR